MKILILGGSGFIGRNLIKHYLCDKSNFIVSIDLKDLELNSNNFSNHVFNLKNHSKLEEIIFDFVPDLIINTAAKCDLEGSNIEDYSINYELPSKLIDTINSNSQIDPIIVFFSTMLVYKVGFSEESNVGYNPNTPYGNSKLLMEQLIKKQTSSKWIIVRPTSIWGPGFTTYKNFFFAVKNKWFFKIKNSKPKKSYGFVLNIVCQVDSIIKSRNSIGKVFYLGDYEPMIINDWSDLIADEWGVRRPFEINRIILYPISLIGSVLNKFGIKFPLTLFRYNNMITENFIDKNLTKQICPKLPFSQKEAVKLTINYLKNNK